MADLRNKQRIRRRRLIKFWGLVALGAIIGLVVKQSTGLNVIGYLAQRAGPIFTLIGLSIEDIAKQGSVGKFLADWIAGPLALGLLTATAAKLKFVEQFVFGRLFPDPPSFVRIDLENERGKDLTIFGQEPISLIGRGDELDELKALLDIKEGPDAAIAAFQWRGVIGASGIGKTRLAIEWLDAAEALKRWDIGILDKDDIADLPAWRSRKPTAFVIDEAKRVWGKDLGSTLETLAQKATPKTPIRVLVLEQLSATPDYGSQIQRDTLKAARCEPDLTLARVPMSVMQDFKNSIDPKTTLPDNVLLEETDGRPRALIAILKAGADNAQVESYAGALEIWSKTLLAPLGGTEAIRASMAVPLFITSLGVPISFKELSARFSISPNRRALKRYFPGLQAKSASLDPLMPEDLAGQMAIDLMPAIADWQTAFDFAIGISPDAVSTQLSRIWQRSGPETYQAISDLINRLDETAPDQRVRIFEAITELIDESAAEQEQSTRLEMHPKIIQHVEKRLFDEYVRRLEALAALNAIIDYGNVQRWYDLESWGKRLTNLVALPEFAANPDIRLFEAKSAVNAIMDYGRKSEWAPLEAWGKRLTDLVALPDFAANAEIRLLEAKAVSNAIKYYGGKQQWAPLEAWGQRLTDLVALPDFAANAEIRLAEAKATYSAIMDYGRKSEWAPLEAWGKRLTDLVALPDFAANAEIRLQEARAAMSAISDYGQEQQWAPLEAWGQRLTDLVALPDFAANAEIRLEEAKAVSNAIKYYGGKQQWAPLEAWGQRLTDLVALLAFSDNADIRILEASAAMSAMLHYGGKQQWAPLEAWGKRLTDLVALPAFTNNADIRLFEAKSAVNAMVEYGKKKRWDDLERWGKRLTDLVALPAFTNNADIRLVEAKSAVNAIINYGREREWVPLEAWGKRLTDLVALPDFADNADIRLKEAKAAMEAIKRYGKAKEWDDLKTWGKRLTDLVETPKFVTDVAFRELEAEAAHSILFDCADVEAGGLAYIWRRRLAAVARQFPYDNSIQYQAKRNGVSYIEQAANSFPYGLPEGMIRDV